jgi:hypothetical protein
VERRKPQHKNGLAAILTVGASIELNIRANPISSIAHVDGSGTTSAKSRRHWRAAARRVRKSNCYEMYPAPAVKAKATFGQT